MLSSHNTPTPDSHLWAGEPAYIESNRPLARVARPLREFLRIESAGSVLLLVAAAVALIWANSPWSETYGTFWHTELSIGFGDAALTHSLQHWVNDALMVIFFFVVGLEIKWELVKGDLRDPRAAALPVIAALGGMVVPALLFVAVTGVGHEGAHGWGIPMATDIAFAVGVLGLLGPRIPTAARLFLLTLAIADDIGAILVIAVFYTAELSLVWLAGALAGLALMAVLRWRRVWTIWIYVVLGVAIWFMLLQSGVHATLAGVAIGLLAPTVPLFDQKAAAAQVREHMADDELDAEEISRLHFLMANSVPPVERIQAALHPLSAFVVLPIFALANAGVSLSGVGELVTSPVALGVLAGLVLGKPLGILLATWLAVKLGVGPLPKGVNWSIVLGLGAVAGIGFTVSLFVAGLAYPGAAELNDAAKVGILLASAISAGIGVALLRWATRSQRSEESEPTTQPSTQP